METVKEWISKSDKKKFDQIKWQLDTRTWLELGRKEILDSLPTFITKMEECGYSFTTTKPYKEILNHAYAGTLKKLESLMVEEF